MAFKLNLGAKPSNDENSLDLKQFERQIVSIEDLLIWCSNNNASDLYIKEYYQPYISRFGKIVKIPCRETSRDEWMKFYDKYIKEELNAKYVREKMLDTSTEVKIPETSKYYGKLDTNYFRYRTSLGFSENCRIATFRMIRPEDPTFDTINYPEQCKEALKVAYAQRTGIVLFTGATGSGKTTTLAACMNTFTQLNEILDNKVIISLEDPIEYTFHSTSSVKFNQKELDKDFKSFASGIKQALREHPNVILVGEARDKEVISAAIEAARTGHLVSSSFHAGDVGGTVSRLLFHLDNSIDLAYDLILNLNVILSQRLLKRDDKYEVDVSYLLFTDYVRKTILEAIQNGQNIQMAVNKLVEDKTLQENSIAKDWTYKEIL